MAFLPEFNELTESLSLDVQQDPTELGYTSFAVDLKTGRLLPRLVEGEEAIEQYLTLLTLTPRGVYAAFSEDYGTEVEYIIGQSLPAEIAELEIVDDVTDAIESDPRVNSTEISTFHDADKLVIKALVTLVDGAEILIERSVDI